MTQVVDTSVLIAALLDEPGGDCLDAPGELFHLSVVNLAELHTKVAEWGGTVEDVRMFLAPLPLRVCELSEAQAEFAGMLRPRTKHLGLSLGDRICLALGHALQLPVLTAEHRWMKADLDIDVSLIR